MHHFYFHLFIRAVNKMNCKLLTLHEQMIAAMPSGKQQQKVLKMDQAR